MDFEPRRLPLFRLVNLTHLAIPPPKGFGPSLPTSEASSRTFVSSPDTMQAEVAPRIEMIIVTVDAEADTRPLTELRAAAMNEDERLHVLHAPCRVSAVRAEWERGARGGESIWDRASRERREWLKMEFGVDFQQDDRAPSPRPETPPTAALQNIFITELSVID
jgi:hypothetical protein